MAAFAELGTLVGFTSLYVPIDVDGITVGLIRLEKFDEGGFPNFSRGPGLKRKT